MIRQNLLAIDQNQEQVLAVPLAPLAAALPAPSALPALLMALAVFVSSVLTRSTFPGLAAYIASKAALSAQARTLAVEFAPLGVRINLVSPGPTATAIWGSLGLSDEQLDEVADSVSKRLLPGHFLDAAAVAFQIGGLLARLAPPR